MLVFRGVADYGDNIGVLDTDSALVESEFSFEGLLGIDDDVLEEVGLLGVLVTNDLHFTVVGIEGLGLDDFNVRTEVRGSGSRSLGGGL